MCGCVCINLVRNNRFRPLKPFSNLSPEKLVRKKVSGIQFSVIERFAFRFSSGLIHPKQLPQFRVVCEVGRRTGLLFDMSNDLVDIEIGEIRCQVVSLSTVRFRDAVSLWHVLQKCLQWEVVAQQR
jgi:hypothetical protein